MQVCRDVAPTSHCFSERKIPVIQRLYVYSHKDGFEVIALVWRAVFSSFRKNSRRHFRHRETGYLLFFSPLTGWLSWFCRIQKYISGFIFRLNLDFPCCSIIKDSHLASTQNYVVYLWLNCYCSDRFDVWITFASFLSSGPYDSFIPHNFVVIVFGMFTISWAARMLLT